MAVQPAKYAVDSTNQDSIQGPQFDDAIGPIQFAYGGDDVPPAVGDSINTTGDSIGDTDHFVGIGDFFATQDSGDAPGNYFDFFVLDDSAGSSGDIHSTGQQHSAVSSAADFLDELQLGQDLSPDIHTGLDSSSNNNHFASVFDQIANLNFDHIDNLTNGLGGSAAGDVFSAPSGPSFDVPVTAPVGPPDVLSDARGVGHGGGGGGGGGGTTPAPYTTSSGTGVELHITYDSSVGNAPAAFVSVVQKVADFFANALQDSTPITINIDVGYGEVHGMRLGPGALGSSVTNLQDVSYTDLASVYSTSGLSLGSSTPTGNLYVSYAEAKALGIAITSPETFDGWVGFSSKNGMFDYNNADGVSTNQYDFYGTVAHEFTEVMGRILLVGGQINNAPSYMAYDLFHYSAPGVQDFLGNGGYFSNDQGATNLAYFNNPSNGGDAGDWASSGTSGSGGSVYDAFNALGTPGHVTPISNTDLLALQALGYDLHLLLA